MCEGDGGHVVLRTPKFRVVRVEGDEGARFPGFYRLIWNAHAAEFSDLGREDRLLCMDAVAAIEAVLRQQLQPTKINLAALGNVVPHLHWHIIPRWADDSHFPAPIWATAVRDVPSRPIDLAALDAAVVAALG
ncbi:HIT family protein [Roseateles sp. DJS-2-20]|uniref:HIT family protein n=1 Tax=Roseateles paludis TaxID=3145238 RepID=A0ABV0G6L9_9BURK